MASIFPLHSQYVICIALRTVNAVNMLYSFLLPRSLLVAFERFNLDHSIGIYGILYEILKVIICAVNTVNRLLQHEIVPTAGQKIAQAVTI